MSYFVSVKSILLKEETICFFCDEQIDLRKSLFSDNERSSNCNLYKTYFCTLLYIVIHLLLQMHGKRRTESKQLTPPNNFQGHKCSLLAHKMWEWNGRANASMECMSQNSLFSLQADPRRSFYLFLQAVLGQGHLEPGQTCQIAPCPGPASRSPGCMNP